MFPQRETLPSVLFGQVGPFRMLRTPPDAVRQDRCTLAGGAREDQAPAEAYYLLSSERSGPDEFLLVLPISFIFLKLSKEMPRLFR